MASGPQVFISFKNLGQGGSPTRDAALASEVYHYLTDRGINVFLSSYTLEKLGADEYKRAIDGALDEAKIMVAVGTSADNLNSQWVRYEWDSFYNDILSGIKSGGRFFTYVEGVEMKDLPRTIRHNQLFHHPDELDSLYKYITKALSADALDRAAKAFEQGRYRDSIDHCRTVLAWEPDNPEAVSALDKAEAALTTESRGHEQAQMEQERQRRIKERLGLAATAVNQEKYDQAIFLYEQVLAEDAVNEQAQAGMAQAKSELNAEEEKKKQERISKLINLTAEALKNERFEEAIGHCRLILSIDPDHATANKAIQKAETALEDKRKTLRRAEEAALGIRHEKRRVFRRKALPAIIVALVLAAGVAGYLVIDYQRRTSQVGGLLSKAETAMNQKRYRLAGDLYRRVLEVDTDNRLARTGLVAAEKRLGRLERNIGPLLVGAAKALASKRIAAAKRDFTAVLAVDGRNQSAKLAMAKIEAIEKRVGALWDKTRRALARARLNTAKHLLLQIITLDVEHGPSSDAGRRISIAEAKIKASISQAAAAMNQGRLTRARALYRRIVSLNREHPQARKALARIKALRARVKRLVSRAKALLVKREFDKAKALIVQAIKIDSNDDATAKLLAKIKQLKRKITGLLAKAKGHESKGQLEEALAAYQQILAIIPGHADAKAAIEKLKSGEARKKAKARRLVTEAIELNKAKKWKRAILKANEALKLAGFGRAYGVRGTAYLMSGKSEKALSDYAKAIKLGIRDKKELANIYGNRCYVFYLRGKYRPALDDCNMCLQLNPKLAPAYGVRAMVFRRLGKHRQATKDEATYKSLKRR